MKTPPPPRSDDGRAIDPALGQLSGEAAQMVVRRPAAVANQGENVASRAASARDPSDDAGTYYGQPLLKEPVWKWYVPAYFFVGGVAGGTALLAAACERFGGPGLARLARRGRDAAAIGCMVGSALLVADLGRPSRFLNMLRVFRPSSPMSVGSWVLSGSGAAAAAAAVLTRVGGGRGRIAGLGRVAGDVAGLLGLPLAGYTAVLLAHTAVPLWQAAARTLPPLYVASAATAACSVLELAPLAAREAEVLHRLGAIAKGAELAAAFTVERSVARSSATVAKPLAHGASGALFRASALLTAGSLALALWPGSSVRRRRAGALLGAVGSLALRFALHHAGRRSARDPRATTLPQRAALAAAAPLEAAHTHAHLPHAPLP